MSRLEYLIEQFKIDSTYIDGKQCYTYSFNYDDFKELLIKISNQEYLIQEQGKELKCLYKRIDKAIDKLNEQIAFTSSYQLNYQSAMFIIEEAKKILLQGDYKKPIVVSKNVMIDLNGKNFRCTCGGNVFTKYDDNTFICNGCGNSYEGDDNNAKD